MRKKLAVTFILVASVFSQWTVPSVYAQDDDLFSIKDVQIINRTSVTMPFYLKHSKTGWVLYYLSPGAKRIYKNVEEIFIKSQNGQRHYVLERNKRYAIEWSNALSLYDVYKLQKK